MEYAVVIEDYENPMSGQLPVLDVGETIGLLFSYNQECFLSKKHFIHPGGKDLFGKSHRTSRKEFSKAQAMYDKDFKNCKSDKGSTLISP